MDLGGVVAGGEEKRTSFCCLPMVAFELGMCSFCWFFGRGIGEVTTDVVMGAGFVLFE